jgi:hypothetical protein
MTDKKIQVTAYAGYRGEESPRSFILNDKKIDVIKILNMWIEEDIRSKSRKRFFKVKGSDGYAYRIYYDEKKNEWFLDVKK